MTMTARDWIISGLLAVAVAVEWLCCAGMLAMKNPYDRLHAIAPANILAPIFVAGAVLVSEGFSQAGIKAVLVAVALILTGPIVGHATARAARIREKGALFGNE
jgi:monovalent cation/proton antiporter MnhG/PhaG subunit